MGCGGRILPRYLPCLRFCGEQGKRFFGKRVCLSGLTVIRKKRGGKERVTFEAGTRRCSTEQEGVIVKLLVWIFF